MTQQPTARRGARPLALLTCALLALCTASCAPFFRGSMDPFSPQVKSVEAFQRDLEPTIIAARNELVTAENFIAYVNGDFIDSFMSAQGPQYSVHTRLYYFSDLDTDHIRDTYNKRLLPLGFELTEERWTSNGVDIVQLLWTNEEYHAAVVSTSRLGEQTSTRYYTVGTPSDGSNGDPMKMINQPGRTPDWFDPNLPPADQK